MVPVLRIGMVVGWLVLLAACGSNAASNSGGTTATGPAQAEGSGQTQTTGTTPAADGAAPMIVLTRSGGMQGMTETLVVLNSGMLRLLDGDINGQPLKEAQATAAQLDPLKAAIQGEDWRQLQATYGAQTPDAYAYTITTSSNTITTYDGADKPPLLEDVLTQLNALWQHALKS